MSSVADQQDVVLLAARTAIQEFNASPERIQQLQDIAVVAARLAVQEIQLSDTVTLAVANVVPALVAAQLGKYGFDIEHPEDQRKDMLHLRTWRELMEAIRTQGLRSVVSYVVAGLMASLVIGIGVLIYRGH